MGELPDGPPDPDLAVGLAEFVGLLGDLRTWAGRPSYRVLARRVGPLMRPARTVPVSTVVDVFRTGRRRLDLDLVLGIVRALGVDEADTDRWRRSCLRAHGPTEDGSRLGNGPAGVLAQLPPDLATFTGREEVLARLLADAAAPRPEGVRAAALCAIEGMAGVGKTQLAIRLAHRLVAAGRFADARLHVNLRGFDPDRPPADPSAVLETFLRQLGVPAERIPVDGDERAAMFRDRLDGRDALVLLDNAADEHQVRPLVPTGPRCLVLVTSRRTMAGLDGAAVHRLDVLDPAEAVDLLAAVAGRERIAADPATATATARACGHLPLALTMAAARLKARQNWSTADLLDHLRQGGIDAVAVGRRSLRPVLDLSLAALTGRARTLFLLLGVQPGADTTPHAAAALAGTTPGAARSALEGLCDEYLLLSRSPGRFELHDLLRAYAADTAAGRIDAAARAAALDRQLAWYACTVEQAATTLLPSLGMPPTLLRRPPGTVLDFSDRSRAVAWLEAEHGNLLAAAAAAAVAAPGAGVAAEAAWRIPAAASVLRAVSGRWPECEALLTTALSRVRGPDLAARAWIENRLGATATELGQQDRAEELFTRVLAKRLLLGDHDGEAAVRNNLVIFYGRTGRPDLGLAHAAAALDLVRRGANTDREASALSAKSACLAQLGRSAEALELIREAVAIREARGDGHRLALAYIHTASRHRELGQYAEAESYGLKGERAARLSGDRFGEGEALLGRAKDLIGQRRRTAAADCLAGAAAIFERLDAPAFLAETRQLQAECADPASGPGPGPSDLSAVRAPGPGPAGR
ncbi:ATP-binding protein [Kitasatospora sp. NPDC088391]|uniref:ATP-binding protein n=1 Tax=Kitasatospora sp. NPDC088391 TaxID=3364074 RepID=UPI0037F42AF6